MRMRRRKIKEAFLGKREREKEFFFPSGRGFDHISSQENILPSQRPGIKTFMSYKLFYFFFLWSEKNLSARACLWYLQLRGLFTRYMLLLFILLLLLLLLLLLSAIAHLN